MFKTDSDSNLHKHAGHSAMQGQGLPLRAIQGRLQSLLPAIVISLVSGGFVAMMGGSGLGAAGLVLGLFGFLFILLKRTDQGAKQRARALSKSQEDLQHHIQFERTLRLVSNELLV